ncbi:MAG: acyl transferase [Chitinophagaceae bacterium]|jgi:hypothetical protein|nr:acyl transferase [Chitinophagaceae bacterium]
MSCEWGDKIFSVRETGFESLVLEVFNFQYQQNPVYKQFVDGLLIDILKIQSINQIPFLPIQFFKSHDIKSSTFIPEIVFESSGTTQTVNSRHLVRNIDLYEESFLIGFEQMYGPVRDFCILGLLPSYLERGNSSLVYMVAKLVNFSEHPESGFYLYNEEALAIKLALLESRQQKTLLIGVAYALLDFAEKFPMHLSSTIIMETGGMKGRKREMIRDEVHSELMNAFGVLSIHAEYGMTELLSQAYSKGNGLYRSPAWMKFIIREEDDPLTIHLTGTGVLNVIDLANIYSCAFIATDDAGKVYDDGSFEVLGRTDGSDLRGCSLMVL